MNLPTTRPSPRLPRAPLPEDVCARCEQPMRRGALTLEHESWFKSLFAREPFPRLFFRFSRSRADRIPLVNYRTPKVAFYCATCGTILLRER